MVRHLIGWSLRFRLLVLGIAAGLLVLGVVQLQKTPTDVLPEFTPPYVEVQTEALGLSAEEVEQLVTVPLEADLLNGTKGVTVLRSQSVPGMSSIVLLFEPGTPLLEARQLVQEQLTQAHANPNVSQPPQMLQPLSSESRLMMIGLTPQRMSPIEASVLARWTIRPRLLSVDGVANVAIFGERNRQLQVLVDPQRLRRDHVTLDQVIRTSGNAQLVSPLSFLEASTPGTGGFIDTANQRLQVRHILPLVTPGKLAQVPLEGPNGGPSPKQDGKPVRLGSITRVVEGHQPLIGDAIVHDGTGLLLVVEKLPGANTLEVTRNVEKAIDEMRPGLAGMRIDDGLFRPADFIREATHNLRVAVIVGAALLALALFALLYAWRTALVCFASFVVALTAATLVLTLTEASINALVFAGLATAVAVVIDDAVGGVEQVRRRLGERAQEGRSTAAAVVVLEAATASRSPMGYATLIVVLMAVPFFFVEGVLGSFVDPLVRAYVIAVAASLLVALTVTPALALTLLSGGRSPRRESALMRWTHARYDAAVAAVLRAPRAAYLGAAGVALIGIALVPVLDGPVVPVFKDRDVLVRLDAPAGTSQPEMSRIVARASRELEGVPGVSDVGGHIGRAVTGDQVVDVNSSELWVKIAPGADYDRTLAAVRRVAGGYPGLGARVLTYERQRIRDVGNLDDRQAALRGGTDLQALTGAEPRPLVVRVFGEDFGVLQRQAQRMKTLMSGIDGVRNPVIERFAQEPTVAIEVSLKQAQRFDVKPGDVRRQAATLLQGIVVGNLFDQQKVFDVVVRAVPEARRSLDDVRALLIDTPGGGHVRLGQIADVRVRPTPQVIQRDSSSRRIDITADVSGRSLGAVQDELRTRLKQISFPLEYHAQVIGDATGAHAGWLRLATFGVAAAIAVLLLLQAAFRRWRLAAVTLVSLPVALVGAEVAGVVDGEFSLGALAGLLAVGAIAARNSVAFATHLDQLQERERLAFGPELIRRGAQERLGPVLVTALATAMALLPFLVLGDRGGYELAQPLAIAVLGGLVTSTALSLILLPALYARFGGPVRPRIEEQLQLSQSWSALEQELTGRANGAPAGGNGVGRPAPNGAPPPGEVRAGVEGEEGR